MDEPDINAQSQSDSFLEYQRQLKKEQNLRYRQRIAAKSSSNETHLVYTTESASVGIALTGSEFSVQTAVDDLDLVEIEPINPVSGLNDEDDISDDYAQSNDCESLMLVEEDSDQYDFGRIMFSADQYDHQHRFFCQLIDFIRAAQLNKTTTTLLLSLLRATNTLNTDIIPKTAKALWNQLDVKFRFECFYFCSTCLHELHHYQDICSVCLSKGKANSELCVFSLDGEIERVVKSTLDVIRWYRIRKNQIMADIVNGEWFRTADANENRLSLMVSTDGKPMIKSKRTQTSIWPIISFLAEIPPPIREHVNNVLLLGLWHGPITPPASLLLDKIVNNIKLLISTGIYICINSEVIRFSINVQLFTGDFPARAKCNCMVNHNGFYACSRCLFKGTRCSRPCGRHTLYRWVDFIRVPQPQRTQQHMNTCAQQVITDNNSTFGVIGSSPLSSILSIPEQCTVDYFHSVFEVHFRYVLSVWNDTLKQNRTALLFIEKCLNELKYPHTFLRRPRDFTKYAKWKASELRTFMIYTVLPVLIKLCLNVPKCFPTVYLSHFILLFIYIRTLRHFDDRADVCNMPPFIHAYLSDFSRLYNPCKELYSVHALVHLWQQVQAHGGLAYSSLFAAESCLQEFEKLAHGSTQLCEQISFWWCVLRQARSKEVRYSSRLFTDDQPIVDGFFDDSVLNNYRQEFDLVFNQMFGVFPGSSFKYYSRYQRGLIIYHSISYTRRQNSNSYSVCVLDASDPMKSISYYGELIFFFNIIIISKNHSSNIRKVIKTMAKRTSGSVTPGKIRRISAGISNTQPAFDNVDDFDIDENEYDENFPVIHNVPFYTQSSHRTFTQNSDQNKKNDVYFTPQMKRKRHNEQSADSSLDSLELMLIKFKDSMVELNRKIDLMNEREVVAEKKFENLEKSLGRILHKVHQNPTPSPPPRELPVIEHEGRNLFTGPIGPTPAHLMKRLINELFTKQEIMDGEHEKVNERTTKIKNAIKIYFFQNDGIQADGFWDYQGKIIRGNQRRGLAYRFRLLSEDNA